MKTQRTNHEIKADVKRPHHYFIGVAMHQLTAERSKQGTVFLKYGPLYFHHSDIEDLQHVLMLTQDKIFKTTTKEALSTCKNDIFHSLYSMLLAARVNQCTIHHFSSDLIIEDEYFELIVNLSNTCESHKDLLYKSKI